MREQLIAFVEGLKTDQRIASFDEAMTKQRVILKSLSLLGWDIFNPDEVRPEYSVGGGNVDYSLRIGEDNKVFIEVKNAGEQLEQHQEQLLRYSFDGGVKLAILTNGLSWWFYLPLREGGWEQRKFYTIDIPEQQSQDIASKFIVLLSKKNIASGLAYQNAEAIYKGQEKQRTLHAAIPKAWNKIISEPDGLLLELVSETTEKLCGFTADIDLIKRFLARHEGQLLISTAAAPQPQLRSPQERRGRRRGPLRLASYTRRSVSAFYFQGARYEANSWKDLLLMLCSILSAKHGTAFNRVLSLKGRARPYFSRNANDLRDPSVISNTNIYAETNLSANGIVQRCEAVLDLFGYPSNALRLEVRN